MKINIISSTANGTFKTFKNLLSSKGIQQEKLMLVSGEKIISDALPTIEARMMNIICTEHHLEEHLWMQKISQSKKVVLSQALFSELDVVGTRYPLLVVSWDPFEAFDESQKYPGLSLVLPLGDPNNLGAAIRSAEAFGAQRVILTKESAHPFLPKALRASSGSVLRTEFLKGPSLDTFLTTEREIPSIALDLAGPSIHSFHWPKNCFLIIGEEHGFSKKPKMTLHIPTRGVESLNAAIATSIALFHYSSQVQ